MSRDPDEPNAPRILVVGHQNPSAPPSGAKLRFDATIRGLAQVGRVDYLEGRSRAWSLRRPVVPPHSLPIGHHTVVERFTVPNRLAPAYGSLRSRLVAGTPTSSYLPPSVGRRAFAKVDAPSYDLVWCYLLPAALATQCAGLPVPTVVDLVDLSTAIEGREAAAQVARWAHRTVLSSPIEAAELGVEVIDNGTEVPPRTPRRRVSSRPTLLFLGWMHYPPNEHAARYLAREIVPALRERLDRFEVRIVGRAPGSVTALGADPDITVTGFVPDAAAEVEAADLVVVPLLDGAGTRLKILEAFAHQTPVVSTPIGAAGLAVEHGRHLLLADEPQEFADACVRLLGDDGLRARLTEEAYTLVADRYDWRVIERAFARTALEALTDA